MNKTNGFKNLRKIAKEMHAEHLLDDTTTPYGAIRYAAKDWLHFLDEKTDCGKMERFAYLFASEWIKDFFDLHPKEEEKEKKPIEELAKRIEEIQKEFPGYIFFFVQKDLSVEEMFEQITGRR